MRYVVRVRLPDRPGALGQVAGRIGSVGGDIVAIDIAERVDGKAVDEFVVELESHEQLEALVAEVHQVGGTQVEDIRQEEVEEIVEE